MKLNFCPVLRAEEVERIFPEMKERREEYIRGLSRKELHEYGWFGKSSIKDNQDKRLKFMERVMEEKVWNKSAREKLPYYYIQSFIK